MLFFLNNITLLLILYKISYLLSCFFFFFNVLHQLAVKFSRERESCLLPLMSSIAFPRNREENITNRTFSFFLRFHFTYFFPYNFEFRFFFLIFFLSPSLNFLDAPFSHGTVEKWRKFEFF
ncbi:hypothetical protein GLYMA_02G129566v4 [Glycine max]|nr:hypothetical protein GLYMA_02G129566v4 [Glycine max]KAH1060081.1 hypothetical protein GYH30_003866 [Glycine max]